MINVGLVDQIECGGLGSYLMWVSKDEEIKKLIKLILTLKLSLCAN